MTDSQPPTDTGAIDPRGVYGTPEWHEERRRRTSWPDRQEAVKITIAWLREEREKVDRQIALIESARSDPQALVALVSSLSAEQLRIIGGLTQ